jgi:hypothetical protein
MIPRSPQTNEEELEPKYQDGSDGVEVPSHLLDRSKTHRANTVGTWPPTSWAPYISATAAHDSDPSGDEAEGDAPYSGTSDHEEPGIKQVEATTSSQIGEYVFDKDTFTLTFAPPAGAIMESPTGSTPNLLSPSPAFQKRPPPRRHTVGGVIDAARALEPPSSPEKKKKRTFLHRLLHIN